MDGRIDPPNARCDECGQEMTDQEMDWADAEGDGLCSDCAREAYEDPDARLGGHDNPYPP